MMRRYAVPGILLIAGMLLTGCQPQPPASRALDDYLQRLSRVLELPHQAFDSTELSQYRLPERRLRLQEVSAVRIGLLDLLVDVRHCRPLQQHISQRNSSLGRMMPASHRLAADGELLRRIDDCLQQSGEEHPQLREQLQDIAAQRRASLPAVFWNALNGSSEFEQLLRFADQPLPTDAPRVDHGILALQQLAELGQGLPARLPPPREELDPLFDDMQRSRSGELIHSLLRQRHTLQQATRLLESPRAAALCPQQRATPKARIMQNILNGHWAEQVQPQLAQVQQLGLPWARALAELQQVPGLPVATAEHLRRLQGHDQALWESWQAALKRHIQAWQVLLEGCALEPGRT